MVDNGDIWITTASAPIQLGNTKFFYYVLPISGAKLMGCAKLKFIVYVEIVTIIFEMS